ncbi:MAG: hypothetical protein A2808_00875 [Candidatus Moranbacteria bacterium RIFCSPHIGHO2_01_FULL_55_24]|nr:MAG: hypothetical protein A2808_00875 [Candidatus Moranbacteria bacterium RIFCSPHIGHO2_01_FULL_55_24]
MAKKVVILGNLGMLGQELQRIFSADAGYAVSAWDKGDVDITDFEALGRRLGEEHPDIVINAAAYNAVDKCEESEEAFQTALRLNRDVPQFLAKKSSEQGFVLVHYSTDYVFDGTLEKPEKMGGGCQGACCGGNCHGTPEGYDEDSMPNPLSRYAESKLAGEQEVEEHAKEYYLIRLSKLFGKPAASPEAKRSFFDTMLEAGRTKSEVQAVDGEKSCFTYAPDLAAATKEVIESGSPYGIYHLPNEGAVTWYEAILELYRQAGLGTKVIPVAPDAFPRPARRPAFSVLLNTKRPPLRRYEAALAEYLSE